MNVESSLSFQSQWHCQVYQFLSKVSLRDASVFSHSSFQFSFSTNTGSTLLKNTLNYATPFSHIFSGCLTPAWQPRFSMSRFTLDHSEQSCASHMFLIRLVNICCWTHSVPLTVLGAGDAEMKWTQLFL